ncbi:MAG: glycosyltransferase family 10 [Candidatus Pacebacteria bacterium]|jgi:hypothetical protein|nr:glycosyltransferase family 10 [Candidatus Paceibacterota bacterium]
MKKILLQPPSGHMANNKIFGPDVNNTSEPWRVLRDRLRMLGYELTTADDNTLDSCAWVFYFDTLGFDGTYIPCGGIKSKIRALFGLKTYRPWPTRKLYQEAIQAGLENKMILMMGEGKAVNPENYNPEVWKKFKYILTWDDDLIDNRKFFKYYPPVPRKEPPKDPPSFQEKKLLANMSCNKRSRHPNELYSERRKTIDFFDKHYPNDFDLYGYLDVPRERVWPWQIKKHKTNRGESHDKIETLSHYKFTVCYENIAKTKGYVSEKILDVLMARSVPVYWGAENIAEYVDPEAFIDRRKFKNNKELADFLFSVTEEQYDKYLAAGDLYLQSEKFKKFLPENFSMTIIKMLHIA